MATEFEDRISTVAALADPVRRTLYRFVAASDTPVSRDDASAATGVPRTLVAYHLDKLVDEQLLDVEFRRLTGRSGPGAGRPAKLYRRSAAEIEVTLPPREYDVAAHLLAQAIIDASQRDEDVSEAVARVAFGYGQQLAEGATSRAGARPTRARQQQALLDVLREHGFEPRVAGDDVVLTNCPFHRLAEQFTDLVCGMNLQLTRGIRSRLSLRPDLLEPELDPAPDRCCVVLRGTA